MKAPKTLQAAIQHFRNYDNCREFMVQLRWADGKVRCPHCDSTNVIYMEKSRLYFCREKHKQAKFSLKVGTVFEDSPIGLDKWLPAVWMLVNCRNGVSSYEIARALGVTQKSAWFMLHRIRLAMQESSGFTKMGGSGSTVEVDETYIGGRARNMHMKRRIRVMRDADNKAKSVVVGLLERGGKVQAGVVQSVGGDLLRTIVKQVAKPGTEIHTDQHRGYWGLDRDYIHKVINHLQGYVKENVHTQGIENFWSLLKRGLGGTYVSVEPFHLFRYVDEQSFRYNNRKHKDQTPIGDGERFTTALSQIAGKRLTYQEVTGKVGQTARL